MMALAHMSAKVMGTTSSQVRLLNHYVTFQPARIIAAIVAMPFLRPINFYTNSYSPGI